MSNSNKKGHLRKLRGNDCIGQLLCVAHDMENGCNKGMQKALDDNIEQGNKKF